MRRSLAIAFALGLAIAPAFAGDVYFVDRAHSEAKFAIRYLLSTATGSLRDVSGMLDLDAANPTASSVKFSIKTASVDTGSVEFDQLLVSAAFLDAARYPEIAFQSSVIKSTTKANVYQVTGDLSLHGVTRLVTLLVEFGGATRVRDGPSRVAFMVRTTLNRKDYGISWNKVLDQGAVLVGEAIEITVNLEASRQVPTATSR